MVPVRSVRFPPQGTGREAALVWVGPRGADPAQDFRPHCDPAPCWLRPRAQPRPLPGRSPDTPSQGPGPHPQTRSAASSHPPTHGTRVDLEGVTRSLKFTLAGRARASRWVFAGHPLPQALVVQDSPTHVGAETFHWAKAPGTGRHSISGEPCRA